MLFFNRFVPFLYCFWIVLCCFSIVLCCFCAKNDRFASYNEELRGRCMRLSLEPVGGSPRPLLVYMLMAFAQGQIPWMPPGFAPGATSCGDYRHVSQAASRDRSIQAFSSVFELRTTGGMSSW